jgi:hypothetical protein
MNEHLFVTVFNGQLELIRALQARCLTSPDEREHMNLLSAIEGFQKLMETTQEEDDSPAEFTASDRN